MTSIEEFDEEIEGIIEEVASEELSNLIENLNLDEKKK